MTARVLFLCTHNAARSQMAEGLLRQLGGGAFEAASAGTEPTRVHPLAAAAMAEIGIDLSGHQSKTLERFVGEPWDLVITLCDRADRECPAFPGAGRRLHWSLPDPSAAVGSPEKKLDVFRRVRDALRARVEALVAAQPR